MNAKMIWACMLATALGGCGNAPGSDGGEESEGPSGTSESRLVTVDVSAAIGDVDPATVVVTYRDQTTDFEDAIWGTLAELAEKPYQVDVGAPDFRSGAEVGITRDGFKGSSHWFDAEELVGLEADEVEAKLVIGRDLTNSLWTCTWTHLQNGVVIQSETESDANASMVLQKDDLGERFYSCGLGVLNTSFYLVADTIFGEFGTFSITGAVAADGMSLDYDEKPVEDPAYMANYHCTR